MTETIIAVYDTAAHTDQAIEALRRAGVPEGSIHRHVRDGDDLTGERPAIVETEGGGLWSALFGTDETHDHLINADSAEAGGTVVRVTMIPPEHYDAVLNMLERFHPSDVRGRPVV